MFGCCKTFSGKYIFSGNANFRKRKIFLCVWLYFKKFSGKYFLVFGKEEGKHKSRKTQATTQKKTSTMIGDRDRDLGSRLTARSRSRSRIAIDGAIAISIRRDLATTSISRRRDRDQDRDAVDRNRRRDRDLAVRRFSSRTRARSLSLSLIFWKCFEGKIEV